MKLTFVPLAFAVAAALTLGSATTARAQDDAAPAKAEKQAGSPPFKGTISAIDKDAKTITLKGKVKERVITLTDDTKITKDGVAATWDDLKAGEAVRGQIVKADDGKEIAKSVMLGEKPREAPKADKPVKEAAEEKAEEKEE